MCVSIYLITLLINRLLVGFFRRPAIIMNARTFSSAADSVGLASTTHTTLSFLFVLYITLPVLPVLLLQSSIVQYLSKVVKTLETFKTLKILEFQRLNFPSIVEVFKKYRNPVSRKKEIPQSKE